MLSFACGHTGLITRVVSIPQDASCARVRRILHNYLQYLIIFAKIYQNINEIEGNLHENRVLGPIFFLLLPGRRENPRNFKNMMHRLASFL